MEQLIDLTGRALVLGAHTDDEFGCAGTIARMVEAEARPRWRHGIRFYSRGVVGSYQHWEPNPPQFAR